MKIVQINSVYKNGSTGRIVESLHKFYLSKKEESFVIYGRGKNKIKEDNVFKNSPEFLSKINAVRARLTGMPYSGNLISTRRIISKIKKINPDVVHIHNLNDHFVNSYKLLTFLAKNKYKVLITLHSEQTYTGTCGYALGCEKWAEGGCSKCPHIYLSTQSYIDRTKRSFFKLKKVYDLFEKSNLNIVGCTPWLTDRAKRSLLLKKFNFSTIINGSNTDDFNILSDVKKDNKNILFVNPRIDDPVKGHQFIGDLVKLLPDFKLTVVGPYTSKTKKVEGVNYVGKVTGKAELSKYYNNAFASIMLSKNECFPMTIIESLMCGTKVCLFKCFGPDDCYNEECVKFSDYGDIEGLAENIKKLTAYSSDSVRNYAIEFLSQDRMCNDYYSYVKSML